MIGPRDIYRSLVPCTVIAVDVGGTKINGALVVYQTAEDAPIVVMERSIPTGAAEGGSAVLSRIGDLILQILQHQTRMELDPETLVYAMKPPIAVGIATAGRVNADTGSIAYANEILPGWTGQPVAEYLATTTGLPTYVLNDVQSYALGEARWGAARGAENCIMVAAGTGLGGGIIANGQVLRGHHGFAGEIGHVLCPQATGIRCSCGCDGHLESVVSGSGMEACYRRYGGDPINGAEIARRAEEGEPLASRIIRQSGFCLGAAIGSWVSILDPELIIISGSVSKAGPLWREAIDQGYASQTPEGLSAVPIVDAELSSQAPIIGAAEFILDALIKESSE